MEHTCEKCNKAFEYNYLLNRHYQNKNQCSDKLSYLEKQECDICNKILFNKYSLLRHKNSCITKNKFQQSLIQKLNVKQDNVSEYGYVYCLSNLSFDKDIYKIGFTKKDPYIRINQLNTTGVPVPFKLEIAKKVKHYKLKENAIHTMLSKYRVNNKREFFKIELQEIHNIFNLIDGELYIDINKN
jgi:hypothetical protein